MSTVDLGFAEEIEEKWTIESYQFPSKVGGKPAWLDLKALPTSDELQCKKCEKQMIFLCQIYSPVETDPKNFHRTLFVFVCRNGPCSERNNPDNLKVFRNSLPRENKFYAYDPPKCKADDSFSPEKYVRLCNLCGCLATKKCSQCKTVPYCSREHQILDWKESHKEHCKKEKQNDKLSKQLFDEYELGLEPELYDSKPTNLQKEMEKYKQLEQEGKTGTLKEISEEELDSHATEDKDKIFTKFKKRVSYNPEQILRYEKGTTPLWIAESPIPDEIPKCEYCGSERQFEFQIMPQILSILNENIIDFGVLVVYTCKLSCTEGVKYKNEFVFKQDVSLDNIC